MFRISDQTVTIECHRRGSTFCAPATENSSSEKNDLKEEFVIVEQGLAIRHIRVHTRQPPIHTYPPTRTPTAQLWGTRGSCVRFGYIHTSHYAPTHTPNLQIPILMFTSYTHFPDTHCYIHLIHLLSRCPFSHSPHTLTFHTPNLTFTSYTHFPDTLSHVHLIHSLANVHLHIHPLANRPSTLHTSHAT